MENNGKNYKRRNYFIKKKFQGRYMLHVYLLLAFLVLTFIALLCINTAQNLTITYDNYDLQIDRTPAMLFSHLLTVGWILMIPVGLALAWLVMRQTHRVAGPLYKFETVLEQMSRGVLDPNVRLRKDDDGQDVMTGLQETNRFLADKVLELRGLTERLQKEEAVGNSAELAALVSQIEKSLHEFEIREE